MQLRYISIYNSLFPFHSLRKVKLLTLQHRLRLTRRPPQLNRLIGRPRRKHTTRRILHNTQTIHRLTMTLNIPQILNLLFHHRPHLHLSIPRPRIKQWCVCPRLHRIDIVVVGVGSAFEVFNGGVDGPEFEVFVFGATDYVVVEGGEAGDCVEVGGLEWGEDLHVLEVEAADLVVAAAVVQDVFVGGLG